MKIVCTLLDKMSARKYFVKMERNLLWLDGDGSYDIRGVLLG
jgi:hypothetical protein